MSPLTQMVTVASRRPQTCQYHCSEKLRKLLYKEHSWNQLRANSIMGWTLDRLVQAVESGDFSIQFPRAGSRDSANGWSAMYKGFSRIFPATACQRHYDLPTEFQLEVTRELLASCEALTGQSLQYVHIVHTHLDDLRACISIQFEM